MLPRHRALIPARMSLIISPTIQEATEVQAELLGRADQHARPRLPVAVLDDGPIVAGRGFRAEVDRVHRRTLRGELAVHLVVDQVQLRLGEHPRPIADWLVTTTQANPASRSRRKAWAAPGKRRTRVGSDR